MVNSCHFIGNLTKDPELKYLPAGTPVVTFRIAVNMKYKDKEEVLFLDVVYFGKIAEAISKYQSKGNTIYVSGRLTERKWESDGQQRSKFELVGEKVHFLGGGAKKDAGAPPEETSDLEPF